MNSKIEDRRNKLIVVLSSVLIAFGLFQLYNSGKASAEKKGKSYYDLVNRGDRLKGKITKWYVESRINPERSDGQTRINITVEFADPEGEIRTINERWKFVGDVSNRKGQEVKLYYIGKGKNFIAATVQNPNIEKILSSR